MEPDGSAQAGWYQPYSGAWCCIHRWAAVPKLCTPPHRSAAMPRPWWLVPGAGGEVGGGPGDLDLLRERAVAVGDAQR